MGVYKKVKFVEQNEHSECALACISSILNYYGYKVSLNELRDKYGVPRGGLNLLNIKNILEDYGTSTSAYAVQCFEEISNLKFPLICFWNNNHFIILEKIKRRKVYICNPAIGKQKISVEEFNRNFSNIVIDVAVNKKRAEVKDSIVISKDETVMNYVKKFVFNNKFKFVILFILMLILQTIYLVIPIFTKNIIDNGGSFANDFNIIHLIILAFIFFVLYLSLESLKGLLICSLQFNFTNRLMKKFMKKVISIKFKYFINRSSGDWINRSSLVSFIQQLLNQEFLNTLINTLFIVVYLILMISYSITLTLITVGISLVILILSIINARISYKYNNKEIKSQGKVQNTVIELFEGIETIKSLSLEESFLKKWDNDYEILRNYNYKKNKISALFISITSSLKFFLPIAILISGLYLSLESTITIGTVVAFLSLAQAFISPLLGILNTVIQIIMLKLYFQRVDDVFFLKEESDSNQKIGEINEIKFESVDFKYSEYDKKVLNNVNLNIGKNEKIAIVGSNGSGKSTLIKIICGLLDSSNGVVSFNGVDIRDLTKKSLQNKISVVNQNPIIFQGTLLENILLNEKNIDTQYLNRVMDITLVNDLINEFPIGFETNISQSGMNLSGGQKQKIAIARALVKKPELLLLDEPTSSLDSASEFHIMQGIQKLNLTCIVISHRLSTIKQFDKVIVLENGKIKEYGSHQDLLEIKGKYYELYYSQNP